MSDVINHNPNLNLLTIDVLNALKQYVFGKTKSKSGIPGVFEILLLLLVMESLVVDTTRGDRTECTSNLQPPNCGECDGVFYYGTGKGCEECLFCPPGFQPDKCCEDQTEGIPVKCLPCPLGTFSESYDQLMCEPCRQCTNTVDDTPCTTTSDMRCGKCTHGYGLLVDNDEQWTDHCFPCSSLGNDAITQETCQTQGFLDDINPDMIDMIDMDKVDAINQCQPEPPYCECKDALFYEADDGNCRMCPFCPPGFEPDRPCGEDGQGDDAQCIACTAGTFSSAFDQEMCQSCSLCTNTIDDTDCLPNQDRVCGTCEPGYGYAHSEVQDTCFECSNLGDAADNQKSCQEAAMDDGEMEPKQVNRLLPKKDPLLKKDDYNIELPVKPIEPDIEGGADTDIKGSSVKMIVIYCSVGFVVIILIGGLVLKVYLCNRTNSRTSRDVTDNTECITIPAGKDSSFTQSFKRRDVEHTSDTFAAPNCHNQTLDTSEQERCRFVNEKAPRINETDAEANSEAQESIDTNTTLPKTHFIERSSVNALQKEPVMCSTSVDARDQDGELKSNGISVSTVSCSPSSFINMTKKTVNQSVETDSILPLHTDGGLLGRANDDQANSYFDGKFGPLVSSDINPSDNGRSQRGSRVISRQTPCEQPVQQSGGEKAFGHSANSNLRKFGTTAKHPSHFGHQSSYNIPVNVTASVSPLAQANLAMEESSFHDVDIPSSHSCHTPIQNDSAIINSTNHGSPKFTCIAAKTVQNGPFFSPSDHENDIHQQFTGVPPSCDTKNDEPSTSPKMAKNKKSISCMPRESNKITSDSKENSSFANKTKTTYAGPGNIFSEHCETLQNAMQANVPNSSPIYPSDPRPNQASAEAFPPVSTSESDHSLTNPQKSSLKFSSDARKSSQPKPPSTHEQSQPPLPKAQGTGNIYHNCNFNISASDGNKIGVGNYTLVETFV